MNENELRNKLNCINIDMIDTLRLIDDIYERPVRNIEQARLHAELQLLHNEWQMTAWKLEELTNE